jgi:hypothetical protein
VRCVTGNHGRVDPHNMRLVMDSTESRSWTSDVGSRTHPIRCARTRGHRSVPGDVACWFEEHLSVSTSRPCPGRPLTVRPTSSSPSSANGAGKTTALMAIAGVLRPERGQVSFGGRPLTGLDPWTSLLRIARCPRAG